MHGDADVTDLIGEEIAKLREVLASNIPICVKSGAERDGEG